MVPSIFPPSRHIDDVIDDGYDVKPLQYFSGGWYVFKSYPVAFLSLAFVFSLVNEALSHLFSAPSFSGSLRTELFYTLPLEMARLCLFHGVEALMLVCTAVMVWQRLENRPLSLITFLKDWRFAGLVLVCATISTLVAWTPIMFMTSLPFVGGALAARVTLPGIIVMSLIGSALFVYVMVSYAFAYLVLIDRKDGIWNALEGSRRVVHRHWGKIGGLMLLFMALNVETYCLLGSALEIMSSSLGFNWLCTTDMAGGQGALVLLMLTAIGRAISGCVLAIAYADIYGAPAA
ncbi:MAG: hypothetical protein M3Z35_17915 [Nitrospirota bacterium]|nr:hypothetical protein [Nitrospirota bacterium]